MIAIEQLLYRANELKATDVYITVGMPPKVRINGSFRSLDYPDMCRQDTESLLASVMSDVQYKNFNESGELIFAYSDAASQRYRISAFKEKGGAAFVIRLIASCEHFLQQPELSKTVNLLYKKERGIVLISGVSGSGKTSTAAAVIDKINSELERYIVTLEEPVEYIHKNKKSIINQRECDSYIDSMSTALKAAADVIFIGEIYNMETAQAAIEAAEAGSLVITTVNALSIDEAVGRITDMFPVSQQQQIYSRLQKNMQAVVQQRLAVESDNGRVAEFELKLSKDIGV